MNNNVTVILSSLIGVALILMIAPNVFAMNRGKVLQNIAIWLAIFGVLGLLYQYVGPGNKKGLIANYPHSVEGSDTAPSTPPSETDQDNQTGITLPPDNSK